MSGVGSRIEVAGTQSIQRAIEVLRVLAANNFTDGVRFSDLETTTAISKGTLYRILGVLKQAGLVEQHPTTRHYYLGMDFLSLGTLSTNRFNIREFMRPAISRLAEQTQDTVFLQIRTGPDVVCIDRAEGQFPIKALALNIGGRRPLGMGASSIALLSMLTDIEVREILERNARRFRNYKLFEAGAVMARVSTARTEGYAFDVGTVVQGAQAVSVPLPLKDRLPAATITVAAIGERLLPGRRKEVVTAVKSEIDALAKSLASLV